MIAERNIHPNAVIHPTAKIDPSVVVGPGAVIGEDTVIGAGSVIGAHAVVEFSVLGKNNRLAPGCFVGTPPQDLKYAGERTRLVMGDNNLVRECVTLNRGTAATGETVIGSNCLFMAYSHVAHDCRIGNHVILVNSVALAGHVDVGDYSVISAQVAVHQFVRVGRCCMISGGSMVGKDIPSYCTAQGDRATLRGLNLVGMRRAGLQRDAVAAVKEAYKTLFLSGLRQEEALPELQKSSVPQVLELADFISRSQRGVMRPKGQGGEEDED